MLLERGQFLSAIPWESVVGFNQVLCERAAGVAHGTNRETFDGVSKRWSEMQKRMLTVEELLDFFRDCHKSAPFLNFNGNVFAELARQILGVATLGLPAARVEVITSLAAHCVAGVLDKTAALEGMKSLLKVDVLRPGDPVSTLQSSICGKITRVLADGRVAGLPDNGGIELIATPETLINAEARSAKVQNRHRPV